MQIKDKIKNASPHYSLASGVKFSESLTVEAKVLGERLGTEHFKAHGDKVAYCPGIFLQTA